MLKILGLGNALVDIITPIDSDLFLHELGLPKGSMQLVDTATNKAISSKSAHLKRTITAGGSAANTIKGIAALGLSSGFIGMIAHDEYGSFYRNDLEKYKIAAYLNYSDTPTGNANAFISVDSERTFATYLGAAIEMNPQHLSENLFEEYDIIHIEGYLVQNHQLIQTAIDLAKKHGKMISLDLASYNVVEANLDFLKNIIQDGVDIIFANEEEAKSFTGLEPLDAVHHLGNHCHTAVVKIGSKGSLIKQANQLHECGVIQANPIDTTGAGDLYASGFLYGFAHGLPIPVCGQLGALLSGKVIEVLGAGIPDPLWQEIHQEVHKIKNN